MSMIHLLILTVHLLVTIARLLRPGGVRAVVAESLLLKAPVGHQEPRAAAGDEPEFVRSLRFGSWIIVRSEPGFQARGSGAPRSRRPGAAPPSALSPTRSRSTSRSMCRAAITRSTGTAGLLT